jgi:hypothetical protein
VDRDRHEQPLELPYGPYPLPVWSGHRNEQGLPALAGMAVVCGGAFMYHGAVEVAYEGFVPSVVKLVGLLLLAVWAIVMAILMWRNGSARRIASLP